MELKFSRGPPELTEKQLVILQHNFNQEWVRKTDVFDLDGIKMKVQLWN